jgi:hypothetical protein
VTCEASWSCARMPPQPRPWGGRRGSQHDTSLSWHRSRPVGRAIPHRLPGPGTVRLFVVPSVPGAEAPACDTRRCCSPPSLAARRVTPTTSPRKASLPSRSS